MKKEFTMKNVFLGKVSILVLLIISMVLTAVPNCGAWEVEVTNSCKNPVNIYVVGEHLFWKQRDCQINGLKPGATATCSLPGGICPWYIEGDYWVGAADGYSMVMVGTGCSNGIGACCLLLECEG